jgi:hypothetical protein
MRFQRPLRPFLMSCHGLNPSLLYIHYYFISNVLIPYTASRYYITSPFCVLVVIPRAPFAFRYKLYRTSNVSSRAGQLALSLILDKIFDPLGSFLGGCLFPTQFLYLYV